MHENNFERDVEKKLGSLRLEPRPPVWEAVEAQIRKDRRRRRGFFWLFFGLLLTAGSCWLLLRNSDGSEISRPIGGTGAASNAQPGQTYGARPEAPTPAAPGEEQSGSGSQSPATESGTAYSAPANRQQASARNPENEPPAANAESEPPVTATEPALHPSDSRKERKPLSPVIGPQQNASGMATGTRRRKKTASGHATSLVTTSPVARSSAAASFEETVASAASGRERNHQYRNDQKRRSNRNSRNNEAHKTRPYGQQPDLASALINKKQDRPDPSIPSEAAPLHEKITGSQLSPDSTDSTAIAGKIEPAADTAISRAPVAGKPAATPKPARPHRWQLSLTGQAGYVHPQAGKGNAVATPDAAAAMASYEKTGPDFSGGPTWSVGAELARHFGKRLQVYAGLAYTRLQIGTRYEVRSRSSGSFSIMAVAAPVPSVRTTEIQSDYQYLSVPAGLRFQLLPRVPLRMQAGITLTRLLAGGYQFNAASGEVTPSTEQMERNLLFWSAGLEYGFRFRGRERLSIGPNIQIGQTPFQKEHNRRLLQATLQARIHF